MMTIMSRFQATRISLAFALAFTWGTSAEAQQPVTATSSSVPQARGALREALTEAALRKQFQSSHSLKMRMAETPVTHSEVAVRPAIHNSPYDRSIILFDGMRHTVVPVGSVLSLPPGLRSHVIDKPKGEFLFWPAFLEVNDQWLAAKEVPLEMAKGDTKKAQAVYQQISKDPHLLVAVYKRCPISILEPDPAASQSSSEAETGSPVSTTPGKR